MVAKLSADILDRLDFFILEIEELQVPKPLLWEYLWCVSIAFTFLGLSAIKKNNIKSIQRFIGGIGLFGYGPTLFAAIYYFGDCWTYIRTGNTDEIEMWQGFPYAILWYAFILLAFQIHFFSIFFAWNLMTAWKTKGSGKKSS